MSREEQVLQALMLDDHWPADLAGWLTGVNMLDVLGVARTEIRHSNILAWLLNPKGSHGLGDVFLECFIKRVIQLSDCEEKTVFLSHRWDDASVTREWGNAKRRLDILIESRITRQKSLVIAIENKIDSTDQKGQLDDYRKEVQEVFPSKSNHGRHLFVYLTPTGDSPVNVKVPNGDVWVNASYSDVLFVLDHVMASNPLMPKNVSAFIADYRTLIRRNVVVDFNLEKCCQSLYAKHKEAFDLVYRYADMGGVTGEAKKALEKFLKKFCEESGGKYLYVGDRKGNQSVLSFQSKAMNAILSPLPNGMRGSWANEDVYYYWFDINPYNEKVKLIVEFGPQNVDISDGGAMSQIGKIINAKKSLEGGTFRRMISFNVCQLEGDFDEKKILARATSAITVLAEHEKQWISKFENVSVSRVKKGNERK